MAAIFLVFGALITVFGGYLLVTNLAENVSKLKWKDFEFNGPVSFAIFVIGVLVFIYPFSPLYHSQGDAAQASPSAQPSSAPETSPSSPTTSPGSSSPVSPDRNASFKFNARGGTPTILVYPGVSTRDTVSNGTYNDGDVVPVICQKSGRQINSHPEQGEQLRNSSTWVLLRGAPGKVQYATLTYGEVEPSLDSVPQC